MPFHLRAQAHLLLLVPTLPCVALPCSVRCASHNGDHQVNLTALSTEFANLLEYQRVMSQLVFTEILASLQQELDTNKDRRNVLYFGGKVMELSAVSSNLLPLSDELIKVVWFHAVALRCWMGQ